MRSKLSTFGGFGGPTEVTSGGNALKFYASVRLHIKRIGLVKKGEEVIVYPFTAYIDFVTCIQYLSFFFSFNVQLSIVTC